MAGTRVVSSAIVLPDTEGGSEELFHRVRFRAASINGVSAFTSYERSVERSFFN